MALPAAIGFAIPGVVDLVGKLIRSFRGGSAAPSLNIPEQERYAGYGLDGSQIPQPQKEALRSAANLKEADLGLPMYLDVPALVTTGSQLLGNKTYTTTAMNDTTQAGPNSSVIEIELARDNQQITNIDAQTTLLWTFTVSVAASSVATIMRLVTSTTFLWELFAQIEIVHNGGSIYNWSNNIPVLNLIDTLCKGNRFHMHHREKSYHEEGRTHFGLNLLSSSIKGIRGLILSGSAQTFEITVETKVPGATQFKPDIVIPGGTETFTKARLTLGRTAGSVNLLVSTTPTVTFANLLAKNDPFTRTFEQEVEKIRDIIIGIFEQRDPDVSTIEPPTKRKRFHADPQNQEIDEALSDLANYTGFRLTDRVLKAFNHMLAIYARAAATVRTKPKIADQFLSVLKGTTDTMTILHHLERLKNTSETTKFFAEQNHFEPSIKALSTADATLIPATYQFKSLNVLFKEVAYSSWSYVPSTDRTTYIPALEVRATKPFLDWPATSSDLPFTVEVSKRSSPRAIWFTAQVPICFSTTFTWNAATPISGQAVWKPAGSIFLPVLYIKNVQFINSDSVFQNRADELMLQGGSPPSYVDLLIDQAKAAIGETFSQGLISSESPIEICAKNGFDLASTNDLLFGLSNAVTSNESVSNISFFSEANQSYMNIQKLMRLKASCFSLAPRTDVFSVASRTMLGQVNVSSILIPRITPNGIPFAQTRGAKPIYFALGVSDGSGSGGLGVIKTQPLTIYAVTEKISAVLYSKGKAALNALYEDAIIPPVVQQDN